MAEEEDEQAMGENHSGDGYNIGFERKQRAIWHIGCADEPQSCHSIWMKQPLLADLTGHTDPSGP